MSKNRSGCDLATLLLVAFIVLKLTHVIDWSWWWVLSPVWISLIIVFIMLIIIGIIWIINR